MENQRPDPDLLLRRVQAEEADQTRGRLKVFFGATAGVGKTYAMLQAAHEHQQFFAAFRIIKQICIQIRPKNSRHNRVDINSILCPFAAETFG